MHHRSEFHLYSIGVVAENKVMSSHEIMVTPIEALNFLDGDIKSNPIKQTVQGVDGSGRNYSTSVIHDNALKATWHNKAGDNRVTSPDVRRGERVEIWRYGDADKFYWCTNHMDLGLRKLETVAHAWSGTADESETTPSATNSYYSEISTHKKSVTFSTSKLNGEVAGYTVQIDAANGFVHIRDDAGQTFELDTKNHRMSLTNADGSQIRVDGKNISIVCSDTCALNATNAINIQTKTLSLKAQSVTLDISDSLAAKIGGQVSVACPKVSFNGEVDIQTLKVAGALYTPPINNG